MPRMQTNYCRNCASLVPAYKTSASGSPECQHPVSAQYYPRFSLQPETRQYNARYHSKSDVAWKTVSSSLVSSTNPYASPRETSEPLPIHNSHIHVVIRLYRWIGIFGAIFYSIVGIVFAFLEITGDSRMPFPQALAFAVGFTVFVSFFVVCFRTSRQLAVDPAGLHRRSRWIGIIMASMLCPILTIPGLYCVSKLGRHYKQEPDGQS